jgi:hypothetical protein
MWLEELETLDREYDKYKGRREQIQSGSVKSTTKPTIKKLIKK